ncbi:hypothetical protein ACVW00_000036 [Marmoricola sp. URHA0025 HA25]
MKIGIATRLANPRPGTLLGGYPDVVRPSIGVHDSLHLSAVWLKERLGPGLLIVAFDGLTVSPLLAAAARRAVDLGDHVVVCASHSHAAPSLSMPNWDQAAGGPADLAYEEWLATQIFDAATEAVATATGGEIRHGRADVAAPVGSNRRHRERAGDPAVRIVEVVNESTRTLFVIHGCHATVLGPDNLLSSSDLPLGLRSGLAARGYPGSVQFLPGGAGDQSTRATRREATFAEAVRLGDVLAEAAMRALRHAPGGAGLDIRAGSMTLPVRPLLSLDRAEAAVAALDRDMESARLSGADEVTRRSLEVEMYGRQHDLRRAREWAAMPSSPIEVTAVRFGAQRLVFTPLEPFLDVALSLEAECDSWLVGYTNDYRGYFMPDGEIDFGGYELAASPFDFGAWDAFRAVVVPLVSAL